MVLKTVHHNRTILNTGNTVKCANRNHVKTYIRQGTVVKTVTASEEGETVDFNLDQAELTPGVVYSLNKKGRWNLPEQIKKKVIGGTLGKEEFKVSYLKQLKLHRRNTCMEYVASCGDIRQIVAKGQSYFNEKSILLGKKRRRKNPKRAFPLQPEFLDEDKVKLPEHPEVHFDVYVPSKKDSVMTYNKKYIGGHDDKLSSYDDARLVQNGRSTKGGRSRTRVCRVLLDDSQWLAEDDFSEDEDDSFDESEKEDFMERNMSCDFPQLVDSAICKFTASTRKEKRISYNQIPVDSDFTLCGRKNKVVFVDKDMADDVDAGINYESKMENLSSKPEMIPVMVQIDEITTEAVNLEQAFGDKYHEAPVFPRKFIIDMTEAVRHRLKDVVHMATPDFTAYLIFEEVEDAKKFDVYHPFRVSLNGNFNLESIAVETIDDEQTYTVQEVIDAAVAYVGILPEESFKTAIDVPSQVYKSDPYDLVAGVCDWQVETLEPEEAYQKILLKECEEVTYASRDPFTLSDLHGNVCNICFEDIGQCGYSATALKKCQHWFCHDCWRHHLLAQINRGATEITCPAHDCSDIVDDITILTLVNLNAYQKYHNLKRTVALQKHGWKWCPNVKCTRAFIVGKKNSPDEPVIIGCNCGTVYCEMCHNEPHWPASCQVAKNYWEKLVKNRDDKDTYLVSFKDLKDTKVVQVMTKQCPKCFSVLEKGTGCDHMICICKVNFCWHCGMVLEGVYSHPYPCKVTPLKRVEIMPIASKYEWHHKVGVSSLYELAVRHHKVRKFSPFQKNSRQNVSKHLMRALPSPLREDSSSTANPARVLPLMEACALRVKHQTEIAQLLRKASALRSELHYLVEYAAITINANRARLPHDGKFREILGSLSFVASRLDMLLQYGACTLKPSDTLERLEYHTSLAVEHGTSLIRLLVGKHPM
ncbi:uncharacterized protein LOC135490723 [Lineus longissimus]|uniref:uncharacterized protein LOC135490723 n=1 Tax=Lineus longissimus TaxID=88925 RepID=UPI002B4EF9C0